MRIGEICALKVSDIDFLAGTIDISRAVPSGFRPARKRNYWCKRPKSNASERVIPLTVGLALLSENRSPRIA